MVDGDRKNRGRTTERLLQQSRRETARPGIGQWKGRCLY